MLKQYELLVSSVAKLQIEEILHYIAHEKQQPLNATKFINKLEKKFLQIQRSPFLFSENELKKTKTKIYRNVPF
jgi:plasmid stabilization system protein ParE